MSILKKFTFMILVMTAAACDLNNAQICDGTWSGSCDNEDGSTYKVELFVYDGKLQSFYAMTVDSNSSNSYAVNIEDNLYAYMCELLYKGAGVYSFQFSNWEINISGDFYPEAGIAEGEYSLNSTSLNQPFTAKLQ